MAIDPDNAVRDTVHVVVGAGALVFQRLQVARRDIERCLEADGTDGDDTAGLDARLSDIERRLDDVLDSVQDQLPVPAQVVVATVRESARDGRNQLRALIGLDPTAD